MSKPKPQRPSTPEEIAKRKALARAQAQDPAQWGVNVAALQRQPDAELKLDGRGGARRARRISALEVLRTRGAIADHHIAAIDRLFEDLSLRAGVGKSALQLERIDSCGSRDLISGASLAARKRLDAALSGAGPSSRAVLLALVEPVAVEGAPMDWKAAVERVTGEKDRHGQIAILRFACENLHLSYREIDYARR